MYYRSIMSLSGTNNITRLKCGPIFRVIEERSGEHIELLFQLILLALHWLQCIAIGFT